MANEDSVEAFIEAKLTYKRALDGITQELFTGPYSRKHCKY